MNWQYRRAARALRAGHTVAYPTEGVWGLGCDPGNPDALARLLEIKQRPAHKGLILIAASWAQLRPWLAVDDIPSGLQAQWPGHLTALLPASEAASQLLTGAHTTVACRISAHPPVRALCQTFGGAITSTSANRSTRPTVASLTALRHQFGQDLGALIAAPLGGAAGPSRIMDPVTGNFLRA